ncbi:MAG: hypothetical protein ACU837_15000 [Gammaproteobacteria bacterium]
MQNFELKDRRYSKRSAVTAGVAWMILFFFGLTAHFIYTGNQLAHRPPVTFGVQISFYGSLLSIPMAMLAVGMAVMAIVRREGMSDDLAMGLVFGLLLLGLSAAGLWCVLHGGYRIA